MRPDFSHRVELSEAPKEDVCDGLTQVDDRKGMTDEDTEMDGIVGVNVFLGLMDADDARRKFSHQGGMT